MSPTELKVLRALVDAEDYSGFCYLSFASISANTRLNRKKVRRACRSLKRKGFAEYGKGLWTEDGEPAGSGYCVSRQGVTELELSASMREPGGKNG